jgi:hypothetical protein
MNTCVRESPLLLSLCTFSVILVFATVTITIVMIFSVHSVMMRNEKIKKVLFTVLTTHPCHFTYTTILCQLFEKNYLLYCSFITHFFI